MISIDDEFGKDMSIKGKAIMESFIMMEPKEVASNSSKNLKTMKLRTWNVEKSLMV